MSIRGRVITAATLGLIGLVLVVIESIEALRPKALTTLESSLLYAGLGVFVIAAAIAVTAADASGGSPHDPPAEEAGAEST